MNVGVRLAVGVAVGMSMGMGVGVGVGTGVGVAVGTGMGMSVAVGVGVGVGTGTGVAVEVAVRTGVGIGAGAVHPVSTMDNIPMVIIEWKIKRAFPPARDSTLAFRSAGGLSVSLCGSVGILAGGTYIMAVVAHKKLAERGFDANAHVHRVGAPCGLPLRAPSCA